MARYYSYKEDFKDGSKSGIGHSNIDCVKQILSDIDDVVPRLREEGLDFMYSPTGDATLGRDMPHNTLEDANQRACRRLDAAKKIHHHIMENIDGKFFEGLDDALDSLNKINEGDNTYKSEHFTYTDVRRVRINSTVGNPGGGYMESVEKKYLTLSDILNNKNSPIKGAQELYKQRLDLANNALKKLETTNKEQYDKLNNLSDQELMETMFPTKLGEYERARSTWKENNKGWLTWVEVGGRFVAIGAIITGTILSGGLVGAGLAPFLIAGGTGLLVADSGYQAISGETISGKRLTVEERIWAGADAFLTAATGGFATYSSVLAKTGKAASTTVQTTSKVFNYADDVNDFAHTVVSMKDDPLGAGLQFIAGRTIGIGTRAINKRMQARNNQVPQPDLDTKPGKDLPTEINLNKKPDLDLDGLGAKIPKTEIPKTEIPKTEIPRTEIPRTEIPSSSRPDLDLPETKKVDVAPDAGKKVQQLDEVDTKSTKTGIGMSEDANYAQKTYGNSFSPEGQKIYSELAGEPIKTIDDLIDAIKSGKIDIKDLPVEYINRDGKTLILNTRTSQALTQSGIPRSDWHTIDRTGEKLHETLLDGQLQRNKLTSEGIKEVRPSNRKG
ncbi:hypothetical protein [Streptococcus oricebi]|uniref:hypothetical protein n=1 Tax=Streptococcus oricebi TaxID=1547447 RepID=UPI001AE6DCB2|nr:hypothetical protein [Streptococcus oricebi]